MPLADETSEIKVYSPVKTKAILHELARKAGKSLSEFVLDAAIAQYLKPKNKKPNYTQSFVQLENEMPIEYQLMTTSQLVEELDRWGAPHEKSRLQRQLHDLVRTEKNWISAYTKSNFKPKDDRQLLNNPEKLQQIFDFTNSLTVGDEHGWFPIRKERTDERLTSFKRGKPVEIKRFTTVDFEWVYTTINGYQVIPDRTIAPKFFTIWFDQTGTKHINDIK